MPTSLLFALAALFGLIFGSFANVLILRDTKRRSILTGRSHCPHCRHELQWYELIPVLSFILQGGKCRKCHKPISWQYPIVELLTAMLAVAAVQIGLVLHMGILTTVDLFICFLAFLVLSGIDIRTQTVPLDYVMVGGLFGSLAMELSGVLNGISVLLGIAVGTGIIALITVGWKVLTKHDGMGSGDMWIAGALGAVIGFPGIIITLIIAVFAGAFFGIVCIILKKATLGAKIPFGPFLFLGLLATFFWGQALLHWYTIVSGLA